MLKSFFGCCPLHRGVSVIAFSNIIWNIVEIFKHYLFWHDQYDEYKKIHHTVTSNDSTKDDYEVDFSRDFTEKIPTYSETFMDYIFMISICWTVLEIISNLCLKQSTFKQAPQKVYAWLVIYYANLIFMVFHLVYFIISIVRHLYVAQPVLASIPPDRYEDDFRKNIEHFVWNLVYTVIISLEILIVHSHYILEEKHKLNGIVQLKWKYISRGKVVSTGVDHSSSSTFNEMTSRQTQEGSRIPPYITNIKQN